MSVCVSGNAVCLSAPSPGQWMASVPSSPSLLFYLITELPERGIVAKQVLVTLTSALSMKQRAVIICTMQM